jgi:hypothetical protein
MNLRRSYDDIRNNRKNDKKIMEWDTYESVDVTGAKLVYKFIPTSIGQIIKVECDICKRELDLTEDWG